MDQRFKELPFQQMYSVLEESGINPMFLKDADRAFGDHIYRPRKPKAKKKRGN